MMRCQAYTKSCAVTGSPLDHLASRSLNVCVKPSSLTVCSSAMALAMFPSSSTPIKPSMTACMALKDVPSSASQESKFLISSSLANVNVLAPPEPDPQAANDKAIVPAISTDNNFFISNPPKLCSFCEHVYILEYNLIFYKHKLKLFSYVFHFVKTFSNNFHNL